MMDNTEVKSSNMAHFMLSSMVDENVTDDCISRKRTAELSSWKRRPFNADFLFKETFDFQGKLNCYFISYHTKYVLISHSRTSDCSWEMETELKLVLWQNFWNTCKLAVIQEN